MCVIVNNNILKNQKIPRLANITVKQSLYYGLAFSQHMAVSNHSIEEKWELLIPTDLLQGITCSV